MAKVEEANRRQVRPLGRPHKLGPGEIGLRDKIMDAAVNIFSRKGIASASLKEISLAAGATPAVIYYHFESKEKLILETLASRFIPLMENVWTAVDESDDPLWIIAEMQRRLINIALKVPWFLSLWSREFVNIDGSLREYTARNLPACSVKRLVAKIRQGQMDGLINPDLSPEMLYMSIIGATMIPLHSQSSWTRQFRKKIDADSIIKHVGIMLAYGYKGK